MPLEPVLIEGRIRPPHAPAGTFRPVSPLTGQPFGAEFPVSSFEEVELAVRAGARAAVELRDLPPEVRADFFETYAELIERRAPDLVEIAHRETGLPAEPRLRTVELPRTTGQLRMAAEAARDRSWCRATIDTRAGIRSMFEPLGGPVLIFGPNNFPFAFNAVSGGDFAAALAAGNPVLAKAHPLHPGTSRLLAEAASEASARSGLPAAAVQMVYHIDDEAGLRLVAHPLVAASAFTGSRPAGLRLKDAADRAGKPISVEMSSVNPVIILRGALEEKPEAIAKELFESCTLGAGQFCTKPGMVILVKGPGADEFIESAASLFRAASPGVLVGRKTLESVVRSVENLGRHGAEIIARGKPPEDPGFLFAPTLLRVSGSAFLRSPRDLQTEAFGSVSLLVIAENLEELHAVVSVLEGSLTGTVYSGSWDEDETAYREVEPLLKQKVGRLLNDRMPTGVAVSPAMNHGGPYPATGHPGFTAVGIPASLLRFAALRCYDGVRPDRLPPELQDRNPNGRMWRLIDGEWTRRDV
jgi:alpha-ketoglutaric semialdehyde dehydrogenase